MRKKSLLLLLVIPLLLSGVLWKIKHRQDAMPSVILAHYPQDDTFRRVTETHLKRGAASTVTPLSRPLLLTTYFAENLTNSVRWCSVDLKGRSTIIREAVAIESHGIFEGRTQIGGNLWLDARQMQKLRALLEQIPTDAPPKLRGNLMLVSFEDAAGWQTRIYDKKALPNRVKQVLVLVGQKIPLA